MKRWSLMVMVGLVALAATSAVQSKPAKVVSHTVTIKGMRYTPGAVTIKPGETVVWVNADDRDHTVVAADGSFNSGNIGPGASFSFQFGKVGVYGYACGLHPRMRGSVVVQ